MAKNGLGNGRDQKKPFVVPAVRCLEFSFTKLIRKIRK